LLTNAIAKTIVTLPIIFMVVGYLCARPIPALAEPEVMNKGKRLLAEITLVLVLFSDASRVRFTALRQNFKIPLRMLVIGMPLTIGLELIVAYVFKPRKWACHGAIDRGCVDPDGCGPWADGCHQRGRS
jgi:NhaP-type Na+/H+ or K+/H+ antiporter